MTRKEAISFAISTRKPIRHSTFGKNEYVKFYAGTFGDETWMIDEEGSFCLTMNFGQSVPAIFGRTVGVNFKY